MWWRYPCWLLLRHLLVTSHVPPATGEEKARIAYVTNAWWPKLDGAAITVMGHARYFASVGHPVLVVRPTYPEDSPLFGVAASSAAEPPDFSAQLLTFLDYRVSGWRGGGYEPEMDPADFAAVEEGLAEWQPDVMLVMDPDMFVLDTFRIPGFNRLMQQPTPPVAIATFTSFCLEAVLKMPEYWWLHYEPMKQLFLQGIATAYGHFDHIFVNGALSREYLRPLQVLRGFEWLPLIDDVYVVSSRGVPADFCTSVPSTQHNRKQREESVPLSTSLAAASSKRWSGNTRGGFRSGSCIWAKWRTSSSVVCCVKRACTCLQPTTRLMAARWSKRYVVDCRSPR